MTRVLAAALAATLFSACTVRQDSAQPTRLEIVSGNTTTVGDFEQVVRASMQKAGVTGLSVAVLNDAKVVYSRQFGWKDRDAGTTLDDATVFGAGSLGKTVFAYVVLLLAKDGVIDLDKPLQQYLSRPLREYPRYADLARDMRSERITARMALSHTTGFPNLRSEAPDGRLRILFDPGDHFSYSGEGFDLLQFAVEEITHKNLETLARERVFIPFRMSHTTYVWNAGIANNVAAHHNEFEWASDPDKPPSPDAAGSMMTTAHDFGEFLAALLTRRAHADVIDEMLSPAVRITSRGMFDARDRIVSGAADATHLSWGLGWGLVETDSGRGFFHTAHKGGVQDYVVAYRDRRIGIVLLSNSDNFESVAPEIVAAGIGDKASPFDWLGYQPYDPTRRTPAPRRLIAIQVEPEVLAPYQGEYEWSTGNARTFITAKGGRLYASDDGVSWDELSAQSDSVFFFKGRTVTLTFIKDADGKVIRIDVENEGIKTSARRIR